MTWKAKSLYRVTCHFLIIQSVKILILQKFFSKETAQNKITILHSFAS